MSRARDLADSADKDIAGTLTLDGLTVDGDATINDPTPSLTLNDTNGTNQKFTVSHNGSSSFLTFRDGVSYAGLQFLADNGTATRTRMNIASNGDVSLYDSTGVSQGLFWDASTQRLGLGTTAPSTKLDVTGQVKITGTDAATHFQLKHSSATNPVVLGEDSSGNFRVYTNAAQRMTITSGGNVGIGTSPARQFHLHDASGDNNLHITNSTTGATATDGFSLVSQSSTNDVLLNQRETANMRFLTSNTERMRIDSSGNVSIGSSSARGVVSSAVNFGNGDSSCNFTATALGTANSQLAGYSFRSTFANTTDYGVRRSADIWSGFNGANWGTEYLAFGVGNNGSPNDAANQTLEKMRIDSSGNVTCKSEGGVANRVNLRQGSSKQWVSFNSAAVILDSYNTSSTTDVSNGQNDVSINNNMNNNDYSVAATTGNTADSIGSRRLVTSFYHPQTGSYSTVSENYGDNSQGDPDEISVTLHGDLA